MAEPARKLPVPEDRSCITDSRAVVQGFSARELVFAVVGPMGSGPGKIAQILNEMLEKNEYDSKIFKASDIIEEWLKNNESVQQSDSNKTTHLQDAGDRMRKESTDNAAIGLRFIEKIRHSRGTKLGKEVIDGQPVEPDGNKRAFILDSLRHPAEVVLLRSVYQDVFCLVGVVCDSHEIRKKRLKGKIGKGISDLAIEQMMERDEKADEKFGQHVADTFHLADFFVDNTPEELKKNGQSNDKWTVKETVGRLVDILTHSKIVRPDPNEAAMFHADGARMRSACLSRQVGAALTDRNGNVIATGTNEVPRAGGGTYGSCLADRHNIVGEDHRCFFHGKKCRNTDEQNAIIREMLAIVNDTGALKVDDSLIQKIRKTRIGQLIEFSRAIHAEMDAILSAARQGISIIGSKLYVTTFPCHNCARHIVAAGIDEVQFIEPYLKSRALPLHGDVITTDRDGWNPPSLNKDDASQSPQVLFHSFVGVAPRFYRRAFYKDRDLKNSSTGELLESFGPPEGMGDPSTLRVSYAQMEAHLTAKPSVGTIPNA